MDLRAELDDVGYLEKQSLSGSSGNSKIGGICDVHSASGVDAAEASSQTTNPMVKLFCGQFLSAGINEGIILFSFAVNNEQVQLSVDYVFLQSRDG